MVANWDLYVDEVKDGGTIRHLGVLLLETGAREILHHLLLKEKNFLSGKGRLGEVHWSNLKKRETELAERWLARFLGGPMMFFVRVDPPSTSGATSKVELVKDLVTHMEASPHIRGGPCKGRVKASASAPWH